ncbi:MAG: hypothetical protein ACI8YQ_000764 [Polaribacter sp.]|jgi:hypothetical protein
MTTNNFITKNITSLLFFCVLCNFTVMKAQKSTETPSYNNEWGLNATGFANQFLSLNGNETDSGGYLLTYKKINGDKAFRLGLGVDVNRISGDEGNSIVPFNQTFMAFDLRLGGEKQHEIGKRWLFTTGFDGMALMK